MVCKMPCGFCVNNTKKRVILTEKLYVRYNKVSKWGVKDENVGKNIFSQESLCRNAAGIGGSNADWISGYATCF